MLTLSRDKIQVAENARLREREREYLVIAVHFKKLKVFIMLQITSLGQAEV